MREIIKICIFILLIFSAIGIVSAANISFDNRTLVSQGWGSTEYEPYVSLSGNNNYIVVAGGPNHDYEVRINLYNKVWELVATGDIPNDGIQFTLYFQYKPHGGNTQIYNTIVTVTGEGTVPILEGVGGTGSSSINQIRVTSYTVLGDIETTDNHDRGFIMGVGPDSGADNDVEAPVTDDSNTNSNDNTNTNTDTNSDTNTDTNADTDTNTGTETDTDTSADTPVTDNSNTNSNDNTNTNTGTNTGVETPITDETNDEESYEKHLDIEPHFPQNNANISNAVADESSVLEANNDESVVAERRTAVADMKKTGLPLAILAILAIIGLVAIRIRR
jgi:hypothetical protein